MDQEYYNSLNSRQREAVEATEGRIRVVAGAGSGKTKALTCRYAYLVNVLGVDPANILCLTFTNKAAQEMKQRISKLVASGDYNDFVCTIHGFCVKFLRQEIHRLGYPKSFTILDEEDQKQLAKQVMEELGLNRTVETVGQFLDAAGNRKIAEFLQQPNYIDRMMLTDGLSETHDKAVDVNTDDENSNTEKAQDMAFVRYLQLQKKTLALDFQDLIFFTIHILSRYICINQLAFKCLFIAGNLYTIFCTSLRDILDKYEIIIIVHCKMSNILLKMICILHIINSNMIGVCGTLRHHA